MNNPDATVEGLHSRTKFATLRQSALSNVGLADPSHASDHTGLQDTGSVLNPTEALPSSQLASCSVPNQHIQRRWIPNG
jgi:hypothetical protein